MLKYHFKKDELDDQSQSLINLTEMKSKIEINVDDLNFNLNNYLNNYKKIFEYYSNIFEYINYFKSKIVDTDFDSIKLNNFINDIEFCFNDTFNKVEKLTNDLEDLQLIKKKLNLNDQIDLLKDVDVKLAEMKSSNSNNSVILNDHNNKLIENYNYLIKLGICHLRENPKSENKQNPIVNEQFSQQNDSFSKNLRETDICSNHNQSSFLSSIDPLLSENNDDESKLLLINKSNKSEWLFVKDKSNLSEIISNKSSLVSINENYKVLNYYYYFCHIF
jgi:hypothetical protein